MATSDAPVTVVDSAVASPDAAPAVHFDIAYINEVTLSSNGFGIAGFVELIDTGTNSIDLSQITVAAVSDDSNTVAITFVKMGGSGTLGPGDAASDLSPLAETKIVTDGVATEPITNSTLDFDMDGTNVASGTYNVNVQVMLNVDGVIMTLPITIHFAPNASTSFDNASRIHSPT